ncbi:hypothetical protein [Oceanivirga salmonicida]|uniref:hypothetical protein n=1 Tax=Oceanivirga salmonicida TaxID=1769291 RepID=UPI00082973CB|nr:hypothetical protein [Oceanivirga salmonicida]
MKRIIQILIFIFLSFASYSAHNVITKMNEVKFINLKSGLEVNKKIEKVNKNKDGNKDGELYIELVDGTKIVGKYIDGELNGDLKISTKNNEIIEIYEYKNNLKNGTYLLKTSKGDYTKKEYKNDVVNGKVSYKIDGIEGNYVSIYGQKNGVEFIKNVNGKRYYLNYNQNKLEGNMKIIFIDGTIKKWVEDDGYNGQVELVLPNKDIIYMTFVKDIQIGNVVALIKGKKKIYKNMEDFVERYKSKESIFEYFGIMGFVVDSSEKNGEHYSKFSFDGITKEYKYRYVDGYITGKVYYKEYTKNTIIEEGYYTFEKGKLNGKSNITEFKDNEKYNVIVNYKNDLKDGKYIKKSSNLTIFGNYKNGKKNGDFESKFGAIYELATFENGLLIKKTTRFGKIKEILEIKKGIIYRNQSLNADGKKYINESIYDGAYEKHKFGIVGENIKTLEGNKNDLKFKTDFLEGIRNK